MNYFYSPFYSDSNGRVWQDFFCYLLLWLLKLGHFEKQSKNTFIVLKCGVGEGWRSLAGSIL
jgi:hypothetical protein